MIVRKARLAAVALTLLSAAAALAQEADEVITTAATEEAFIPGSYFWLTIMVGVILAVSFELILTHLSVAAGIGAVGPFDRRATKEEAPSEGAGAGGVMTTAKKTSNLFGVWTLVTATISLFFATWLAVNLSNTPKIFEGLVLGLAIWALFYIVMTVIEVTALTCLVGSLLQTAIGGLRSAYKATTTVFGKSEEDRVVDTTERVTAAVRAELFGDMDAKGLCKQIKQYIRQIRPASAAEIKSALSELLDETEIKAIVEHEEGPFENVDILTASLQTEAGMTREKARHLAINVKNAISRIREEYRSDKDAVSKITDASMEVAGRSEDRARATHEKIEAYLRDTHKEALDPEGIKRDLEKLFHGPREGLGALRERLSHFDRSTLRAVIAQRKDMSEQETNKITDRVMSVIDRIRGKAAETAEAAEAKRHGMEAKVRNYLNSLGRPELRYEGIKHDIQVLFHDPKAGADLLIRRLKAMDRDTLKAIVASRKDLSDEDAEHIVAQMEHARDETIAKCEHMKEEVHRRVEDARAQALHEAEEAQKVARNAAWWTFGSAVASAAAATGGGILSTYL